MRFGVRVGVRVRVRLIGLGLATLARSISSSCFAHVAVKEPGLCQFVMSSQSNPGGIVPKQVPSRTPIFDFWPSVHLYITSLP